MQLGDQPPRQHVKTLDRFEGRSWQKAGPLQTERVTGTYRIWIVVESETEVKSVVKPHARTSHKARPPQTEANLPA